MNAITLRTLTAALILCAITTTATAQSRSQTNTWSNSSVTRITPHSTYRNECMSESSFLREQRGGRIHLAGSQRNAARREFTTRHHRSVSERQNERAFDLTSGPRGSRLQTLEMNRGRDLFQTRGFSTERSWEHGRTTDNEFRGRFLPRDWNGRLDYHNRQSVDLSIGGSQFGLSTSSDNWMRH